MSNVSNIPKPLPDPLTGPEVIDRIATEADTIFLSFSCGKDSVATWLAIRDRFESIIPYYLYLVPDLEFVEESLVYYEGAMGCRIHRMPHPSLYRLIRNYVYQPPPRIGTIEHLDYRNIGYDEIEMWLARDLGMMTLDDPVSSKPWSAHGVRAWDSPMRRTSIKRYGAINHKRRRFYPIWDMNKEQLLDTITRSGVKLARDYRIFGRSFDGLDRRFLELIRQHFPRDYARILDWFPLAELDLLRYSI